MSVLGKENGGVVRLTVALDLSLVTMLSAKPSLLRSMRDWLTPSLFLCMFSETNMSLQVTTGKAKKR